MPVRTPKFLIVSGDSLLRQSLGEKLRRERFACTDFHGYDEARSALATLRPDVLIVDLGVRREGLDFIESLPPRSGLLVLLGDRSIFGRDRRLPAAVDALFLRPLRLDVIVDMVRELLIKRKLPVLRRHERVPVRVRARLRAAGSRREKSYSVSNISAGGMFVEGDVGSDEFLRFSLHEGSRRHPPLRGIARARWRRNGEGGEPSGVGLEFTCLFHNVTSKDLIRFAAESSVGVELGA